VLVAQIQTSKL